MEADTADRSVPPEAPESVTQAAGAWIGSIHLLVSDILELAGLEAKRAGKALGWIIGLAAAAVVCLFAVWGLLSAALVLWMVESGVAWSLALTIVALTNAVLAVVLTLIIMRLARRLSFPAMRRVIGAKHAKREDPGKTN